jgi:hypothetical protein
MKEFLPMSAELYFLSAVSGDFSLDPEESVLSGLLKQYETVIVESLITSFGLDFLLHDRHGGDVDTIHNVRQIGRDEQMVYKNRGNQQAYKNRGEYDSSTYHKDSWYINKNTEISRQKKEGKLTDAYTGEKIAPNGKSDLDHVMSAKEIHDDPGRVLAGVRGTDLANSGENLKATNPHTNRTKKADSMDTFLEKHGGEYTEQQKERMRGADAASRKAYERKLAHIYYTSPGFMKDTALAAGKTGVEMGLRQALGFVFTEVWFAVKSEFANIQGRFDLGLFLSAIGNGVRQGFENAKEKYRELLAKFKDGAISGVFSQASRQRCATFSSPRRKMSCELSVRPGRLLFKPPKCFS